MADQPRDYFWYICNSSAPRVTFLNAGRFQTANIVMQWLLVLLLIVCVVIALFAVRRTRTGGGAGKTILCIPGLGNGAESFDWPRVDPEIPDKIGVRSARSLKNELEALGHRVVVFDPPDNPGATIAEYNAWIEKNVAARADIVMGHSAGAHVAAYYAHAHGIPCILLDPTPRFIWDKLREFKLPPERQGVARYEKTARYAAMYTSDVAQTLFAARPAAQTVLIYSIDQADPTATPEAKEAAMRALPADEYVRVDEATHWVHVTNPDVVIDAVKKLM